MKVSENCKELTDEVLHRLGKALIQYGVCL